MGIDRDIRRAEGNVGYLIKVLFDTKKSDPRYAQVVDKIRALQPVSDADLRTWETRAARARLFRAWREAQQMEHVAKSCGVDIEQAQRDFIAGRYGKRTWLSLPLHQVDGESPQEALPGTGEDQT